MVGGEGGAGEVGGAGLAGDGRMTGMDEGNVEMTPGRVTHVIGDSGVTRLRFAAVEPARDGRIQVRATVAVRIEPGDVIDFGEFQLPPMTEFRLPRHVADRRYDPGDTITIELGFGDVVS